jgi:hypothetical protein
MQLNKERRRRSAALAALDPTKDWHEIYKRLTLWELPAEARFGFQLAFYRPLAVPRMARLLHSTGHMQFDTTRRAYDTGLIMHEIIHGGVDSDRGRKMVGLLNRLHDRPDIYPEDMTYLLAVLTVVPTRFMDNYGWRPVTDDERYATWRFWDVLGERMKIRVRPSSYAEAEKYVADYEASHLAPSEAGALLTQAALEALRDQLPWPIRPAAAHITSALVGDPVVARAISLPSPARTVSASVHLVGALRRRVQRLRPPSQEAWFTPGQPAGRVYPRGYSLDELGPPGG